MDQGQGAQRYGQPPQGYGQQPPQRGGGFPQPPPKKSWAKRLLVLAGIAVVVLIGGLALIGVVARQASKAGKAASAGFNAAVQNQMDAVMQKVADEAIKQYELVKANDPNGAIRLCVQAGMVKAAMIQAKNATGVQMWSATEKADCARAGVPMQ